MIKFYDPGDKAYLAQAVVKRTTGVNGGLSLSGEIFQGSDVLQKLDRGWSMLFEGDKYVVTYKKLNDQTNTIEFDAIQEFFWDFAKTGLYEEFSGSHTFDFYISTLFKDTKYQLVNNAKVAAFEKDNWGMKNRLDLFNDVIKTAGVEFSVHNQIVTIDEQLGSDLTSIVRQGINLSDLTEEMKISDFATYGKGFGAWVDKDDHSKGRLTTEYRSELADIYGDLAIDPIVDERYTNAESLKEALKEKIDATYRVSISLNIYDLENAGYANYESPHVGDFILAINEKLNFKRQIRIIKLEEDFDANGIRIGYTATCGDLSAAEQYQNSQSSNSNKIEDIQKGVNDAITSANGKNTNYYGGNEPSDPNEGDIWYDMSDNDPKNWVIKQWSDGRWNDISLNESVVNETIDNAVDGIQDAVDAANDAYNKVQGEVDDFNNQVSTIDKNLNDYKTETDGKIANANNQITNINSVANSAYQQSQNALNNLTVIDSKVVNLGNDVQSKFDTLNNGYQLTLQELKDMQIGGQNFIKNGNLADLSGKYWRNWNGSSGATRSIEKAGDDWPANTIGIMNIINPDGGQWGYAQDDIKVDSNASYVVSALFQGPNGTSVMLQHGNGNTDNWEGKEFTLDGSKKRFSFVFTTGPDATTTNIYVGFGTGSGTIQVSQIKLERGNKATDWSPAPEDLATQTQITVLTGLINSKVSNSEYQSDKTQTANLIASKVSSGDFNTFKTQTENSISNMVTSKDFNSYRTQTDSAIQDKVSSATMNSVQTQLTNLINSKVSSSQYQSDKTQTDKLISLKVSQEDFDNLKIGGTNLLKNSKFDNDKAEWRDWGASEGATREFPVPGNTWDSRVKKLLHINKPNPDGEFGIAQDNIPIEPNSEYIVSLINDGGSCHIQLGNGSAEEPWRGITVTGKYPVAKFKTGNATATNLYIGFDNGQTGTAWISLVKFEKGNRKTDWSLSPRDQVTSAELSVMNDAITSRVNGLDGKYTSLNQLATGLQTTVGNNYNDLKSQITQTNSSWQAAIGNVGQTNLIYNSDLTNDTDGWTSNTTIRVGTNKWDSYNGSNSLAVQATDVTLGNWRYAYSKKINVVQGTKYSLSATLFCTGAKGPEATSVRLEIDFFDKSGNRVGFPSVNFDVSKWNQKQLLKVENQTPPETAVTACLAIQINGNINLMVNRPMLVATDKVGPYQKDSASLSSINMLQNAINLRVQKGDVVNQINIDNSGVLIAGQKVHITGQTVIDNAVIKDAMIGSMSANKLTAGTIDANSIKVINLDVAALVGNKTSFIQSIWNSISSSVSITSQGIVAKAADYRLNLTNGDLKIFNGNGDQMSEYSVGWDPNTANIIGTGIWVDSGYSFSLSSHTKGTRSNQALLQISNKSTAENPLMDYWGTHRHHGNDVLNTIGAYDGDGAHYLNVRWNTNRGVTLYAANGKAGVRIMEQSGDVEIIVDGHYYSMRTYLNK